MTPQTLDYVKKLVTRKPILFSEICREVQESGSHWQPAQIRLCLHAYAGIEVGDGQDPLVSVGTRSTTERLREAIYEAVQGQGGRPIQVARVLELLPSDLTTSVAQILAVAKIDTRLTVTGPMIRTK
ncbi:MAG: hypothetical protein WCO77_08715 [bacterium]